MLVWCGTACGHVNFDDRTDAPDTSDVRDAQQSDPSLIAHYEFDDDPNDGVLDSTGHGHTGGCNTTCPAVEPGKLGGAYRFNGATDFIVVPDSIELRPAAITATVWMFRTSATVSHCLLQKLYGTTTMNSWQSNVTANGVVQICTTATAAGGRCDQSPPNTHMTNRWHHIAYIETGTSHGLYVDGVEILRFQTAIIYDAGPVLIGADIDNGMTLCTMEGLLDDARIYNRVLSDAEIAALAAE